MKHALPADSPKTTNGHTELHSVAQEAERLHVSKGWLYTEIRAGRFPHLRLGVRVLLDPAEVDVFLAARAIGVEEALRQIAEDTSGW